MSVRARPPARLARKSPCPGAGSAAIHFAAAAFFERFPGAGFEGAAFFFGVFGAGSSLGCSMVPVHLAEPQRHSQSFFKAGV